MDLAGASPIGIIREECDLVHLLNMLLCFKRALVGRLGRREKAGGLNKNAVLLSFLPCFGAE